MPDIRNEHLFKSWKTIENLWARNHLDNSGFGKINLTLKYTMNDIKRDWKWKEKLSLDEGVEGKILGNTHTQI